MKISNNLRFFLEKPGESDSYVTLSVDKYDITLKLADCQRNIAWYFPIETKKGLARARRKINRLKNLVDSLHDYLWALESPKQ